MSTPRLPDGWTVRPDPRTWRVDGGATWIGGSPPRVLRLSSAARARLGGPELVVTDPTSAALARLLSDAGVAHPVGGDGPAPDEVTVVVPVKDRTAELDRLLAAVRATAPAVGIVVVDDGSDDPAATAAVVGRYGGRVVGHETSRGPSAGRNTGARACTTPVIAFLDSDVVPEPGWLETLLGHLGDPAVGIVAPRIVAFSDGGDENAVTRYERRRSSLDLGARPAPVTARSRVAYVPSAALLVRREAFGTGFREDMPVAEDVDLVWRIAAAGWRLRYEPAARVAHEHRARVRAWLARKAFYGTGAAPLARQHPRRVPPVALAPWTAAAVALLGVQRRWSFATAGVVTLVATARLARGLRKPGEPWLSVRRHPTPWQESVV
ncbi:mycofactocin biosynthesis glycosyltransferase MftF, partial [Actinomycetospora soli]|uniref:mycofactocin biosynthesis glycosyltransferase MftF n=1 Tax=Actinomycetospora soli TaxID=2893887 RepID=UPI001E4C2C5A